MIYQLTNSRGEIIETSQCDLLLDSSDIEDIRNYLKSITAKFNKMKANFLILSSNGKKTLSCSDLCELVNDANTAYRSSLLLCSRLCILENKIVDYQLLVDENVIKEANFKALL